MKISILKADYLGEYKIRLIFSDKVEKIIDFQQFLLNAKNPTTRKYINQDYFSRFELNYGDLVWNDYELCFPIWDLYQNKI